MSFPPRVPPSLLRGRPLKNVTCPYCAAPLDPDTRTKEHVIGRRFVPKGSTENRWNLILWACSACNNKKSDLEDDIAAITMYFHTTGPAATEDPTARAEALRRGPKSGSRKTGKPVADSHAALESTSQLGPVEMTFGFVAPPQIDDTRAYELARMQMLGFFGSIEAAKAIAQTFPPMQLRSIRESSNSVLRFREEESLPESEDVLFQMPAEEAG